MPSVPSPGKPDHCPPEDATARGNLIGNMVQKETQNNYRAFVPMDSQQLQKGASSQANAKNAGLFCKKKTS